MEYEHMKKCDLRKIDVLLYLGKLDANCFQITQYHIIIQLWYFTGWYRTGAQLYVGNCTTVMKKQFVTEVQKGIIIQTWASIIHTLLNRFHGSLATVAIT